MKMTLVYPSWRKLDRQTEFNLPPHGPVVFAATVPPGVALTFVDENLQEIDFGAPCDLVGISVMLTCQLPRAFEIAGRYRERGIPVLFGGIATMLHAEEVAAHADSVFLGEAEGRFAGVLDDFSAGRLKKTYDYMNSPPDMALIGTARREILARDLYNYRGVQMLDLVHASRGCRFNCYPCCSAFLGGKTFRPRPIDRVIEEMEKIPNNRLFIVDNSLAQDRQWLIDLFTAMAPLKKKWVSHPILDDDRVLKLAADAGAWYVYQAVIDTSDLIRNRIRRLKEHGIAVEGTILLGTDEQDEDSIRRLVDFLLEIGLDVAEFTIMTPFPHSPLRTRIAAENRLLSDDWGEYTADRVVFRPRQDVPGETPGDVPLRLGHVLCGRRSPDQDGGAFREGDPAGDGGRYLLPVQSPQGERLPETEGSGMLNPDRILLVHPLGYRADAVSGDISRIANIMPPIGLASIAASLERRGVRATIVDCYARPDSDRAIRDHLLAERPAFLGISCTTSSFLDGIRIAEAARAALARHPDRLRGSPRFRAEGGDLSALSRDGLRRGRGRGGDDGRTDRLRGGGSLGESGGSSSGKAGRGPPGSPVTGSGRSKWTPFPSRRTRNSTGSPTRTSFPSSTIRECRTRAASPAGAVPIPAATATARSSDGVSGTTPPNISTSTCGT